MLLDTDGWCNYAAITAAGAGGRAALRRVGVPVWARVRRARPLRPEQRQPSSLALQLQVRNASPIPPTPQPHIASSLPFYGY
eukprot:COSAG05_NODE_465_length_9537_cov_21.527086_11_plen_82_part_00